MARDAGGYRHNDSHPHEPALAARLLTARTEAHGGYLDLRDIELETLVLFVHAADSAYGCLTVEGVRVPTACGEEPSP